MEKLKKILLPVILVLVLLLPILIDYVNSRKISVITYDEFNESIEDGLISLTFVGNVDTDDYKELKKKLVNFKSTYEINVNSIKLDSLSTSEMTNLLVNNTPSYLITQNGKIVKVLEDVDKVDAQLNKYVNYVIPEDEITYKTLSTYKEFKSVVDSKKVSMHVFGRNTCYYCNIFKPVYNDLAIDYSLDSVYYYDSDSFDSTEYEKILNSGLKIPAECTSSGEEIALSSGFGTPLTLFTKKGKVVGCISGYVSSEKLEEKLKSVGMIK